MIERFLYLKLCWDNALGYLSIFNQLFDKIILSSVFLKVFDINEYWLIAILVLVAVFMIVSLGHFIIKYNIFTRQVNLSNRYNPQINQILEELAIIRTELKDIKNNVLPPST